MGALAGTTPDVGCTLQFGVMKGLHQEKPSRVAAMKRNRASGAIQARKRPRPGSREQEAGAYEDVRKERFAAGGQGLASGRGKDEVSAVREPYRGAWRSGAVSR
jgi:hypothetical protein